LPSLEFSELALDLEGDGSFEFQGSSLVGQSFTYAQRGVYTPVIRVTDLNGQVRTAATLVHVYDLAALDLRLQAVWQGLKDALRAGDITRALTFVHTDTRARYELSFQQFSPAALANIDQYMTTVQFIEAAFGGARYEMVRPLGGQTQLFAVWFQIDGDGLWRLRRF
jgi:hypothetical protein